MTASRAVPHLAGPPPPARLRSFPGHRYMAGRVLYRSHRHGNGPWWFSNSGEGRFDLTDPLGTCYLAEDEVITLLETWGGISPLPRYEADERDASTLAVRHELVVADLTSNMAAQYQVTAEIFTTTDYPRTQRWATHLQKAGFAGVRYWARHDLAHTHACVALFDSAGDPGPGASGHGYDIRQTTHLPRRKDLLDRFEQETGIMLLDLP